jgi:hypothetical protein
LWQVKQDGLMPCDVWRVVQAIFECLLANAASLSRIELWHSKQNFLIGASVESFFEV